MRPTRQDYHDHPILNRRLALFLGLAGLLFGALSPARAANLTVVNLDDSGPGSLRQAIAEAAPGDTIDFGVTGAIVLTSGELVIGKDLSIVGPGSAHLTISGNNASRVFDLSDGTVILSGLTIANGKALEGGGVRAKTSNLTLTNCAVVANDADYGGGIHASLGSTLNITDSLVSSNVTHNVGGGIYVYGGATLLRTTVANNTGEGLYAYVSGLSCINCTVSGNSAAGVALVSATAVLDSSTVYGNNAQIWGNGTAALGNCIVGGTPGGESGLGGTLESLDYNLIQNTNGCTITGDTAHNVYGQDPLLGPLQDNGGPTPTHALLPGSPAIDSGSSGGLTTDQRGTPRPCNFASTADADDGADIGAFELQGRSVTTLDDSGPGSLRQAIAEAAPGDTIDFGVAGAIVLTSGQLVIDKDLTLSGPGVGNLTISGNGASRVLKIERGMVSIAGLTVANGRLPSLAGPSGSDDPYSAGAGICNAGTLTLSNCAVSGNTIHASGVGGPGIFNMTSLRIDSCLISSNHATGDHGGIMNWGTLAIADSTLAGNTCGGWGGAINNSGVLAVTNSTISGNSAGYRAGAILNTGPGESTVSLESCTLSGNRAGLEEAGAILNLQGTVWIRNTIVGGNFAPDAPDCKGAFVSGDFNLIGDTTGAVITGDTAHNIYGKDPLLGPLEDNGGPTPTHALLPGSPAIDSGSRGGLTTDQRGYAWPVDRPGFANAADGSDIGAYEVGNVTLHVWPDSPSPALPHTDWSSAARTLQDAVDASIDGDVVLVTNGLYNVGGRAVFETMTNRVAIDRAIKVQSVNGPAVTLIEGSPAPGGGHAEGAIRCAYLGSNAVMSGFTLTNGYTRDFVGILYSDNPNVSGGGVWCEASGVLTNCIVVHNSAQAAGGGVYGGNLAACTLAGNQTVFQSFGGGGAYGATLRSCTVVSNTANAGGGAMKGTLYECTVTGNVAWYEGGGVFDGTLFACTVQGNHAGWHPSGAGGKGGGVYLGTLFNCVLVDNSSGSTGSGAAGCSLFNCTVTGNWCSDADYGGMGVGDATLQNCIVSENTPYDTYNTVEDHCYVGGNPLFVNPSNGNYRLRWDSPCLDAGTNLTERIAGDLDGNPRPVDGNGDGAAAFDIGAYEFVPVAPAITQQPVTQTISPNGQATFTVSDTGNPPPTYQWYFGTSPIEGATAPTFTVTNAGPGQVGCYSVAVTNFVGGFTSPPACLWLSALKMYAGVNVYGPVGGTCAVEYTTNIETEPVEWTALTNVVIQATPEIVIDYGSADQPKRFYRSVPLP